ncbi:hypothetical protein ACWEQ0_19425 [Nocardia thailandica]|uniref:Uncharacterized protein n=1 Tax=Nocardia thailandica TaxID=257275 RepID=A0ABW6PVP1_9NOCA
MEMAWREGRSQGPTLALWALWPAGLLLALLNAEVEAMTPGVFLTAAGVYAAAAAMLLRSAGRRRGPAVVLAAAPVMLFVGAGYTGEPTAAEPGLLLVNTAVLFLVATAVLLAVLGLVWRLRSAPAMPLAMSTVTVLMLGTGGFLLDLLARAAVVLAGAAPQQYAVEGLHWSAAQYLRGLSGPADFLGYMLVWLDLVQIAYVVSAFVAAAGLARLVTSAAAIPRRTGALLTAVASGLALTCTAAVLAAIALPQQVDAVPATLAFVLSIPFMATLLPAAVGVALLTTPQTAHTSQESR